MEQGYSTEPSNEYIVRGNDALMKCKIPSYAADMAEVMGWVDSEGHDYRLGNNYGNLINSSSYIPKIEPHAVVDIFFSC